MIISLDKFMKAKYAWFKKINKIKTKEVYLRE